MVFGEPDIDAMLEDLGVPVVLGAVSVKGLVDFATEELAGSEGAADLHGSLMSVLVRASALPGIVNGAAINVDGAAYRVTHLQRIDDGGLLRIHCAVTT